MTKKTRKELEAIAMHCSAAIENRGGLDTRDNDTEDFPEIAVWSIKEMLEKAYELGRKDARK